MERVYVRKVLEFTGGNKLKAARLLNIDPKTLRAKLG
jgi:DNA-binding protein Fis